MFLNLKPTVHVFFLRSYGSFSFCLGVTSSLNSVSWFSESQKKKANNQDDSDDDDDDDDEAGPSVQPVAAVQPQAGYATPMAQLGMPVAGGGVMLHGGYPGKDPFVKNWSWESAPTQVETNNHKFTLKYGPFTPTSLFHL